MLILFLAGSRKWSNCASLGCQLHGFLEWKQCRIKGLVVYAYEIPRDIWDRNAFLFRQYQQFESIWDTQWVTTLKLIFGYWITVVHSSLVRWTCKDERGLLHAQEIQGYVWEWNAIVL